MLRISFGGVVGERLSFTKTIRLLTMASTLASLAASSTLAGTSTFSTPGTATYTVPAGVTQLQVTVAGAGGGGGGADGQRGGNGGNGDSISAKLDVFPGEVLDLIIGAGGGTGWTAGPNYHNNCSGNGIGGTGFSAGASGGPANCQDATALSGVSGGGGGGGGSTSLAFHNGIMLFQAAGGGGGGGANSTSAGSTGSSNGNTLANVANCNASGTATAGTSASGTNPLIAYANDGGGGGGYTSGTGGTGQLDSSGQSSSGGSAGQSCASPNAALSAISVSSGGGNGGAGRTTNTSASDGSTGGNGFISITILLTNPTLTVSAITNNATGTLNFVGSNGWSDANGNNVTTSQSGVASLSPTIILAATGTDTTITQSSNPAFVLTGASCSDNLGHSGFASLNGNVLTIPATHVVSNAALSCTFTNDKANPSLAILKTTSTPGPVSKGNTITYTYKVTNSGNVPINNVTVADNHLGKGTLSSIGSKSLLAPNSGQSSDSPPTASNVYGLLAPGDSVTFTSSYTVIQKDIDLLSP